MSHQIDDAFIEKAATEFNDLAVVVQNRYVKDIALARGSEGIRKFASFEKVRGHDWEAIAYELLGGPTDSESICTDKACTACESVDVMTMTLDELVEQRGVEVMR